MQARRDGKMLQPVAPRSCSSFCRPPRFVCLYVLHRYVPFAQEVESWSWETLRRTPVTPGLGRCAIQCLGYSLPAELCYRWLFLGLPRSHSKSWPDVHRCPPIAEELSGREVVSSCRSLGTSRRERHRRSTIWIVSKRNSRGRTLNTHNP